MLKATWADIFGTSTQKFIFMDIGARGGLEYPWKYYQEQLSVIAFEPDEAGCTELGKDFRVINKALSDSESEQQIYLTKQRSASSLLQPNFELLRAFPNSDRFEIEKTRSVPCASLNALKRSGQILDVDFAKIDTQGTEFEIIQSGKDLLSQCVGLQVEVEFHELYKGQKLFGDVDKQIRDSLDMGLQDLRKVYWKYKTVKQARTNKGSLIFADALYLRSPESVESWLASMPDSLRIKKAVSAIFTGYAYGYYDYCIALIEQPVIRELLSELIDVVDEIIDRGNRNLAWNIPQPWRSRIGFRLYILASMFRPTYQGWGSSGEGLGNLKRKGFITNY